MKESLILISFSTLLFASSGILSQPTDEINTVSSRPLSSPQIPTLNTDSITLESADKKPLLLANVGNINNSYKHQKNSTTTSITETTTTKSATQAVTLNKHFSDEEIAHLRQLFLQAENALKKKQDKTFLQLSEQLKDYPLYPYLQYSWLKKHLDYETQIKQFLQQHRSSRYANMLERKWLHYLGKHKQWSLLLENKVDSKNTTLNCYYHRAQLQTGDEQTALIAAKKLWAVGHSQPSACDALFSQLKKSPFFDQNLRWQRFDAALRNNKIGLASYVKDLMPAQYHFTAQLWLNLHRHPSRYMPQLLALPESEQTALMFRHAIDRLARKDVTAAIKIWDANKQRFDIDENLAINKLAIDKLERRLAFKLVFEGESDAYHRLGQLDQQDNGSRTWRVRVALSEQNWPNVLLAIQALDAVEKTEDKWRYWAARAYMETDNIALAQALFSALATERSFYGFLAADKVNSLYQLSDSPVNVSIEEINALKNSKEFRVAFELMVLDRKNEAKLQWWHAVRSLNKSKILVASKLAQKWQWNEIAIFTIAKAKYWDDIDVRFPISYADKIQKNSAKHNLNPVIIYGLIRRESAFNEKARSPTGARGLMQIMPRTGRYIARSLNERWRGNNSLYNPATNVKYGSYYYQKLLDKFDGHYALALAAYNAGPNRVKKWLPEAVALPADIWIETIPYKETREYVINVLAYALIYQQRAQLDDRPIFNVSENKNKLSMNDLARDIIPLSTTP